MRRYATALLTLLIALFALPATAVAAPAGGLKQLAGVDGCISGESLVPAGCQSVRALQGVGDVVVSPDGKNVYASSTSLDAIVAFNRNTATGALTQKDSITGCITSNVTVASPPHSCNLIPTASALDGVTAIAISPDGENLYAVTNTGIVTTLNRTGDGTLSFNEVSLCCNGSGAALSVTVSPDGASVYAVGPWFNGMVEWLTRVTAPGATHGDLAHGAFYQGPGPAQQNLGNSPSEVKVTPDGKELLITTGAGTNAVLGWDRATSGALTPSATPSRCVSSSDLAGTCQARPGLLAPQSLALADNGATIVVGSQQSLTTIRRDASSGTLTPDAGNCFGYPTSVFSGCAAMPGTSCCFTFFPARDVVSTPDGQNVYLGTESSNPALWGFSRSGGGLALEPPPLRCVSVTAADTCETFRQGNRIQTLSAANDGRQVYAGGDSRMWVFAVDRPPVCQDVSASTLRDTTVMVTLNCSRPRRRCCDIREGKRSRARHARGRSGQPDQLCAPDRHDRDGFVHLSSGRRRRPLRSGDGHRQRRSAECRLAERRLAGRVADAHPLDGDPEVVGLPSLHEGAQPDRQEGPGRRQGRDRLQDQEEEAPAALPVQVANGQLAQGQGQARAGQALRRAQAAGRHQAQDHDHRAEPRREGLHLHGSREPQAGVEAAVPSTRRQEAGQVLIAGLGQAVVCS